MSRPRRESLRRVVRWLVPAAALTLMPKCVLCAAAYLGLGAALGLSTPELCGASPNAVPTWALAASAGSLLAGVVVVFRLRARAAVAGRLGVPPGAISNAEAWVPFEDSTLQPPSDVHHVSGCKPS